MYLQCCHQDIHGGWRQLAVTVVAHLQGDIEPCVMFGADCVVVVDGDDEDAAAARVAVVDGDDEDTAAAAACGAVGATVRGAATPRSGIDGVAVAVESSGTGTAVVSDADVAVAVVVAPVVEPVVGLHTAVVDSEQSSRPSRLHSPSRIGCRR